MPVGGDDERVLRGVRAGLAAAVPRRSCRVPAATGVGARTEWGVACRPPEVSCRKYHCNRRLRPNRVDWRAGRATRRCRTGNAAVREPAHHHVARRVWRRANGYATDEPALDPG